MQKLRVYEGVYFFFFVNILVVATVGASSKMVYITKDAAGTISFFFHIQSNDEKNLNSQKMLSLMKGTCMRAVKANSE